MRKTRNAGSTRSARLNGGELLSKKKQGARRSSNDKKWSVNVSENEPLLLKTLRF